MGRSRRLHLLLALALAIAAVPSAVAAQQEWNPDTSSYSPSLAVVVMDLGYREDISRMVLNLPPQVALAWAPEGRLSRALAPVAHQRGHLLLAQVYMRESPAPQYSITAAMNRDEIQQRVDQVLAAIPFVDGLLPLQSSEFSLDDSAVHRFILSAWKHRPLTLVDPWISSQSQIYPVARQYQLTALRRNQLLDVPDPAAMQAAWQQALAAARNNGSVLVMAAAELSILEFLQEQLTRLPEHGLRLVDLEMLAAIEPELKTTVEQAQVARLLPD